MSRTDNHAPAWVKERDPYRRHEFHAEHDHWISERRPDERGRWTVTAFQRSVPCDLEVFLNAKTWVSTRCRMVYRGGRNIYCGCRMCTGHDGRKLARKQDRVIWRAVRQQLLAGGMDGYDVPAIRGKAW